MELLVGSVTLGVLDSITLRFCLVLKKIDVTSKAVAEILSRATEYLQPNPGNVRARLETFP